MSGAEIVKDKNQTIAIIVRKNIKIKGVRFFTPANYPFQIGFHHRPKDVILKPHRHPAHNYFIRSSQEVLYVLEGKIKVFLYNNKGKTAGNRILNGGDSVLFVSGGHGIKFLKKSKVFEVKQGPYPGDEKAKIYL